MTAYGYARVSTTGQKLYGNGLEAQSRILREHGAQEIYADSYTGTKRHRPNLDRLLDTIQQGDIVIVAKLDRLARSVRDGLDIIDQVIDRGATLRILNIGTFDNTAAGKLQRTIMLAFAEFERDMIVQRTQEGKEIARATNPGYTEGRPKVISNTTIEKIKNGVPYTELGVSRATWYRYRKEV